jgi:hypothetical protein
MEMEEWLVPQMKVRAVALVTGDIHKPVNGAQRLDEFCVCHPSLVIALSRDPLGEGWAWNRSAMPVRGLVRPRHRNYLDGDSGLVQAIIAVPPLRSVLADGRNSSRTRSRACGVLQGVSQLG